MPSRKGILLTITATIEIGRVTTPECDAGVAQILKLSFPVYLEKVP